MGLAVKYLSVDRRKEIARGLFQVTKDETGRDELLGLCPIHGEKNPSFAYNYQKDQYHCLSCGASGDLIRLFSEVHRLEQKEGFQQFCREYGIESDKPAPRREKQTSGTAKSEKTIPESDWAKLPLLPDPWVARLEATRKWTRAAIEGLDLRLWTPPEGEKRIAIPVRNDQGELVNIRLYLPGASENKLISWGKGYGRSRLWPNPANQACWVEGPIWLCEGEPDTICAIAQGLTAVTQTAGATSWKAEFSAAFKDRDVIIAYDADQVGQKGALKAARSIAREAKLVRILQWPDFMGRKNGEWPDDHGQDLTDWFVRHGRSVGDLMSLVAQAQTITAPAEADPDADGPSRFFVRGISGRQMAFKSALLAAEILSENELVADPESSVLYRWTGSFWEEFNIRQVQKIALEKLGVEGTRARAEDAATQVAVRAQLQPGMELNPNPDLLCLQNGMLDLETMKLLPHDRTYLATYQLGVAYDPTQPADCDRWKQFLAETIQDAAVIGEMQEFFGYCLIRSTEYEKALLLVGPGADGKSTCLNVLQSMIGDQNCANVDLSFLDNEFHRASLHNKALNVATEVESQVFTSGYFKGIVSGDRMNAAYKHQPVFEFRPYCKLAFSSNRFPRVQDNSYGFFRRVLPVRFRKQFAPTERDTKLIGKLMAELSGVFSWSLDGLQRLRERGGFVASDDTLKTIREYQEANNPVLGFIQERCSTEPAGLLAEATISKRELYGAYVDHCKQYGFMPLNEVHFARELREAIPGVSHERRRNGDGRSQIWKGVRLVSDPL